jgi:hypothetical protein
MFDTGGQSVYAYQGPPWPTDPNDICQRITAAPGESVPILLKANIASGVDANGLPIVVNPQLVELIWIRLCNNTQGYEILGSQIHFRPGGAQQFVFELAPHVLPISGLSFYHDLGIPLVRFGMESEPGSEYQAFSDTSLTHLVAPGGTRIYPRPGYRLIHAPDGTFLGTDNVMTLDLPGTPGMPSEFFRVQTAEPLFGHP